MEFRLETLSLTHPYCAEVFGNFHRVCDFVEPTVGWIVLFVCRGFPQLTSASISENYIKKSWHSLRSVAGQCEL